ncbi:MAG: helix-turn-helix transcriptional regulator [Prevotella sp.]|nr:helix-turn-helix transcriptional regulator [Prevotella sp.]
MELEFYIYGAELRVKDGAEDYALTERHTDIIQRLLALISERYTEAYDALCKEYARSRGNAPYYQFLIVRRFCKCNFGNLDGTHLDLGGDRFAFERVECPLRGECRLEGIVCNPRFNTTLSAQERRVMRLLYDGQSREEIGDNLYISPITVKNHIASAYAKLGVHDRASFVRYAERHGLFKERDYD